MRPDGQDRPDRVAGRYVKDALVHAVSSNAAERDGAWYYAVHHRTESEWRWVLALSFLVKWLRE